MRIVKEISHPRLKITVFHYNGKYSIKFEKQNIEQLYKFEDLPVDFNPNELENIVSKKDIEGIEKSIDRMIELKSSWISDMINVKDEEFPKII